MSARTTFSIRRHPVRSPGWWVSVRVEWGTRSVEGVARNIPFRTRQLAAAWIGEQFR